MQKPTTVLNILTKHSKNNTFIDRIYRHLYSVLKCKISNKNDTYIGIFGPFYQRRIKRWNDIIIDDNMNKYTYYSIKR